MEAIAVARALRSWQLAPVPSLGILLLHEIQLARTAHQPANVFATDLARARLKPAYYPFFIGFRQVEARLEAALQQQFHAEAEHLRDLLDIIAYLQELLGLPSGELLNIPQTPNGAQEVELPIA